MCGCLNIQNKKPVERETWMVLVRKEMVKGQSLSGGEKGREEPQR